MQKKGGSLKNYNIINLSIENALTAVPAGTAGGYIALLDAPTNANVRIHLNEQMADGIPLKPYHAIEANGIEKIFISANAVAGGTIKIIQAVLSKDFRMVTPASDVNVDTITKILDKFRPDGTAIQQTINAGASYTFTKANETSIRFHATDEVGVELNANGIKFPLFEEELLIDNLSTLKFHNNNAAALTLTIWSM